MTFSCRPYIDADPKSAAADKRSPLWTLRRHIKACVWRYAVKGRVKRAELTRLRETNPFIWHPKGAKRVFDAAIAELVAERWLIPVGANFFRVPSHPYARQSNLGDQSGGLCRIDTTIPKGLSDAGEACTVPSVHVTKE